MACRPGTVKRFWIRADLRTPKAPANTLELQLTNSGNEKMAPLRFGTMEGVANVRVGVNECEARLLAPGENCTIELTIVPSSKDEAFEWPVDVGDKSMLTLQLERRHGASLDVDARNR